MLAHRFCPKLFERATEVQLMLMMLAFVAQDACPWAVPEPINDLHLMLMILGVRVLRCLPSVFSQAFQ